MNDILRIDRFPSGQIFLPPSKSVGHRALICGALAGGGTVRNAGDNDDIRATIRCLSALGAELSSLDSEADDTNKASGNSDSWRIESGRASRLRTPTTLDCGESGSTLRFLIPLAALYGSEVTFTGRGRLMERPLDVYETCLGGKGVSFRRKDGSLTVRGPLPPGVFRLPGDVSSQFITGLLLALPLLSQDSLILLETPLQSASYVDLTLAVLADYGIKIENNEHKYYKIYGNQRYRVRDYAVEADYSGAAFFLAAAALGRPLELMGLNLASVQGDRAFLDLLRQAGYEVQTGPHGGIKVTPSSDEMVKAASDGEQRSAAASSVIRPRPLTVDVGDIPDLVPPLAALLAFADGESRIENAERLRIKESDRLATVTRQLNRLGAEVIEGRDSLIICGKPQLRGGLCFGENDHRIAMMCGVAAIGCETRVTIDGYDCVKKSYPGFWRDFMGKEKS